MASTTAAPATPAQTYPTFPIDQLEPSPLNPRKRFDAASLAELARSILLRGEVIVPLLLRPAARGRYEIVDGERRWRAVQTLNGGGPTHVPGLVREDLTDAAVLEIQLLSAIQRQDLTPLEEAAGYRALIDSSPSQYSAAYIADKIGRSEKYVWDRMKLLDLIPDAAQLLDADCILVGHAEILAKLKPEDQARVIEPTERWSGRRSGLWEDESARLFDDVDEPDEEDPASVRDRYRGLKPVTVRELESWVAHHVRFDVDHLAEAAPLDFGPVKQQVDEARARPGRGKKLIAITHEYRVDDDAKDASERTYGSQSWKRADDPHGTCDHSVLGVVVAGRGYGSTLPVCIARDKCQVHWAKEIKAKEKNAKLRAKGAGGRAAQNEAVTEAERRAEAEARERDMQAWRAMEPALYAEAVAQVKTAASLTSSQAAALEKHYAELTVSDARKHLGAKWHQKPAAALLVMGLEAYGYSTDSYGDFVENIVKPFGLKLARFEAIREKHTPKAPKTATAPGGKKTAAKTTKTAKKAAKR